MLFYVVGTLGTGAQGHTLNPIFRAVQLFTIDTVGTLGTRAQFTFRLQGHKWCVHGDMLNVDGGHNGHKGTN